MNIRKLFSKKKVNTKKTNNSNSIKMGTFLVEYESSLYLKFDATSDKTGNKIPYLFPLLISRDACFPQNIMTINDSGVDMHIPPKEAFDFFDTIYRHIDDGFVQYSGHTRYEMKSKKYKIDDQKFENHPYYHNIKLIDYGFYTKCSKID